MPDDLTSSATNPTADSDYLNTLGNRSDEEASRSFVAATEGLEGKERAQALSANGLSEEQYSTLKQNIGWNGDPAPGDPHESQLAHYGKLGLQAAIGTGLALAVPEVSIPAAILAGVGTTAGSEIAQRQFPNHPLAAGLVGGAIGGLGAGAISSGVEGALTAGAEGLGEAASGSGLKAAMEEGANAPEASEAKTVSDAIDKAYSNPMTPNEVEGSSGSVMGPVDAARLHLYGTSTIGDYLQVAKNALRNPDDANMTGRAKTLLDELSTTVADRYNAMAAQDHGAMDDILAESNSPADKILKAIGSDAMTDPDIRARFLTTAAGTDWSKAGMISNLYVNSLLSFNSVAKKAGSDLANIPWQLINKAISTIGSRAAETLTNSDNYMGTVPGEATAMLRAVTGTWRDAMGNFLDAWKSGQPVFEGGIGMLDAPVSNSLTLGLTSGSGVENTFVGKGLDALYHIMSIPSRSIIAIDQFAKTMQYNMSLYASAARQALADGTEEGLIGPELSTRVSALTDQYIQQPASWMADAAANDARVNTFSQDLDGSLAKLDQWRASSFIGRTLFPFMKTPVNITLQGMRQSPLALLSPTFRNTVAGGGPEGALALSKMALGSTILGFVAHHVLQGDITGAMPSNLNPQQKQDWLYNADGSTAHQPYSVKIGSRWISYGGLEPLAWLIGTTADAAPAFSYSTTGETAHIAGVLQTAAVHEMNRQPIWGALHDLMEVMNNADAGKESGIEKFAASLTSKVIPQTVADLATAGDPVHRQTNTFMDAFRNRIPWLREGGLPTLNSMGEPEHTPPGFTFNEYPAFKASTGGADALQDKLLDLWTKMGYRPPEIPHSIGGSAESSDNLNTPPEKVFGGAGLDDAQRNKWLELRGAGGQLRSTLETMIKDPDFQQYNDYQQATQISGIFHAYQKMAEYQMLGDPSTGLMNRVQQAKVSKLQTISAPRTFGAP